VLAMVSKKNCHELFWTSEPNMVDRTYWKNPSVRTLRSWKTK
jgi:hypothetical protein